LAFSQVTAKEMKDKGYLPENKYEKNLQNYKGGARKLIPSKVLEKMEFL
jgi:hypothetical protein